MKKIIVLFLSLTLLFSFICGAFSVSAAVVNKGVITIGTTKANTGDEIQIPIDIAENPGIMAITISITYDSKSLEYIEFLEGSVLKDYTVADHPNKNIIRFVSCESTDKKRNGTLLTLRFRIKDNAEWDFSKIDIKYSQGDFCNWNLDKIMPTVNSGGVDIAYNGSNCSHKEYGDWNIIAEPTCDSEGVKERICKKCNHLDSVKIAESGHEFPEEWTVEKVATKDEPGTMVRYCLTCNTFVDRIEYTIEDSEEGEFDNQIGTEIPKNDIIEDNFAEQNPDEEFTPIKPPVESKPESSVVSSQTQSSASSATQNDTTSEQKPANSSQSSSASVNSKPSSTTSAKPQSSANDTVSSDKSQIVSSSNTSSKKPTSIKDAFEGLFGGDSDSKDETSKDNTTSSNDNSVTTDNNSTNIATDNIDMDSAIKAKITEVFPNFDVITECFKTAIIVILILILL